MSVSELRIHGVGGSPGERLLGLSHPDHAVVVGEGYGTVFLARRRDRTVEGYDWGGLTSGSPWQPLWVLLLPFTLVNVAGWAHPPFDAISPRRLRALRILLHLAAGLLTATWVCWLAIIGVDHLGYRLLGGADGWLAAVGVGSPQLVGTVLGALLVITALWGLGRVASTSRHRFEGTHAPTDGQRPRRWGPREDLTSRTFFGHEASVDDALSWHTGTMIATGLALLGVTFARFGEEQLLLGHVFVLLGAVQIGVIVGMLLVGWSRRGGGSGDQGDSGDAAGHGLAAGHGVDAGHGQDVAAGDTEVAPAAAAELHDRPRGLPAAAVTLAVALTNGVFSGLVLLVANLHDEPQPWGPELALMDGFVVALGAWAVLTALWLVGHLRRGRAEDVPSRRSAPATELDGLDDRQLRRVAAQRGLATAGHGAAHPLTWFAWLFLATSLALTAARLEPDGPAVWTWLPAPEVAGPLLDAAAWLLPLLVLGTVAVVWRATRTDALRRGVGILWDVLTFWPRRYHPLAVRPHTERAVPEFRARIDHHLDVSDGVLVSAHSQGTVIAFAALLPLVREAGAQPAGTPAGGAGTAGGAPDDLQPTTRLSRLGLLTYGSPLRTLYGPVFPAYTGAATRARLAGAITAGSASWHNLWRRTDPIGGPVFAVPPAPEVADAAGAPTLGGGTDIECPDPAIEPASVDLPEEDDDPEPLRRAWTELCGHSYFYRERAYKDATEALCAALAAGTGSAGNDA